MANGTHNDRYEQLYQKMVSQAATLHKRNKQRIKVSIILMMLMITMIMGTMNITDNMKMKTLITSLFYPFI